jgi:cell division protein ZapA
MPQLTVVVNDRTYAVSCDDGEEEHLRQLAQDLDQRVRTLAGLVGQVGDTRLLAIVALMLLDELGEAKDTITALKNAAGAAPNTEETLAEMLESATSRLEAIAARMTGT